MRLSLTAFVLTVGILGSPNSNAEAEGPAHSAFHKFFLVNPANRQDFEKLRPFEFLNSLIFLIGASALEEKLVDYRTTHKVWNYFTLHQSNFILGAPGCLFAYSFSKVYFAGYFPYRSSKHLRAGVMVGCFLINYLLENQFFSRPLDVHDFITGSIAVVLLPLLDKANQTCGAKIKSLVIRLIRRVDGLSE